MLRRAVPEDAEAIADVFLPAFAGLTFLPKLHDETALARGQSRDCPRSD